MADRVKVELNDIMVRYYCSLLISQARLRHSKHLICQSMYHLHTYSHRPRVLERDEYESKTWKWEKKKKVFVFSEKINYLPSEVVYSIGRHRWDIDATLFMDMAKNWHLKHKTLHFENAYENMLSIRLISYILFMFFHIRHINSRRKNQNKIKSYIEMARVLYRSACCNLESEIILLE